MRLPLRRLEEKLATLAKILKTYGVDKILGYRQLPPNKDRQILFGWEEKNDLPKDKDLIISRPQKRKRGDITIATREDYISYFSAIAGCTPEEFAEKSAEYGEEIKDLKLEVDFAKNMANFLITGDTFAWGGMEFLIIKEKIS